MCLVRLRVYLNDPRATEALHIHRVIINLTFVHFDQKEKLFLRDTHRYYEFGYEGGVSPYSGTATPKPHGQKFLVDVFFGDIIV